ncbi:uncharacterized protein LOC127836272 [Dreissena polymorpha]|uniref:uncharacterized protein LOC127836272 n=1 Tax=Dreissena polymorpha TaxID=45954 RepID=UPI002264421A|nr:uncharacterized protein LOC127836272 [Dreissena polymorpha]
MWLVLCADVHSILNLEYRFLVQTLYHVLKSARFRFLQNDHCYFDDFAIGSSVNVTTIDNSDASWKVGRRVVELDTLAESLSACSSCQVPIYLLNTVERRDFGLACVLDIPCCNYGAINNVASGRKHGRVYDMNTKLALAMVEAGVGVRQINSILSTLNIPAVNHTMLIRTWPNNEIDVSVDAGWQKRGSGRAFDSLSGHCSMVGTKTGKVLAYAVRSKTCRVCSQHKKKERTSHIIQIAAVHTTGKFSTYVIP